jgi:GT2 family glycosyltransferase
MIDVIIPTRNAPEVLALTLAHYWANAHDETLVASVTLLDNCSSAPGMDRIFGDVIRRGGRVLRQEGNIGVWASVNRGLALAQSEQVLVLTSDVLLAPEAVAKLSKIQEEFDIPSLGPRVVSDQITHLAQLYSSHSPAYTADTSHYNGACWMMKRSLLNTVGWYDPQFYICFGDTDYNQRLLDAGVLYGVTDSVRCLHLDKQSRRHDFTEGQDTEVEMTDARRFHTKWQDRPDVLAKHPQLSSVQYAIAKVGWKDAIPA